MQETRPERASHQVRQPFPLHSLTHSLNPLLTHLSTHSFIHSPILSLLSLSLSFPLSFSPSLPLSLPLSPSLSPPPSLSLSLSRWGWMLLQRFHSLLTHKELNQITDCITGATISLKTLSSEDQEISAPSQATNLPVIAVFKPQPLAPQLAVKQSRNLFSSALSSQKGPFIYSALFKRKPQDSSSEVLWVQGDPAEVLLMISNPLPFEIRIEKMVCVCVCVFVRVCVYSTLDFIVAL